MMKPDTQNNAHDSLVYRSSNIRHILSYPRWVKALVLLIADCVLSVICLLLAVSLRYGHFDSNLAWGSLIAYSGVPLLGLLIIGFYDGVSRVFVDAVMRNVLIVLSVAAIVFELMIYYGYIQPVPRAAPLLYIFFFFIWLWNSRLSLRYLIMRLLNRKSGNQTNADGLTNLTDTVENVLIFGAGVAGKELLGVLNKSPLYNFVGFIDDSQELVGGRVLGLKVYHSDKISKIIEKHTVKQVFIAVPSAPKRVQREIIKRFENEPVKISTLPSMHQIAEGQVLVTDIKSVDILDILDRDAVEPDEMLLKKNIQNHVVMVTGAGGSIGSELCRQILRNRPAKLVLVELSEYALYTIGHELKSLIPANSEIQLIGALGNVTNQSRIEEIIREHKVQTIYHAAAYKHVPIVESNPFEGVINNAFGTHNCAQAAFNTGVETFVLISTDKAVRPTNIMGASKRIAELVCQGFAEQSSTTRFSMVRFGNVLGSSGSVVPLFKQQIKDGGPITVTHPDVTRYFMTIPEAAQLVIQAGAMANGGEVFVLDMGEPIKITDLAKQMIHLSGFEVRNAANPQGDIEIKYSGLRPGEKLYEELIIGGDNISETKHSLIMRAIEARYPLREIQNLLMEIKEHASSDHDVKWLQGRFQKYVEGYVSNADGMGS